jgi:hypothetical protein
MRLKFVTVAAALAPLLLSGPAPAADLTPSGLWQAIDSSTKEPTGWFLISEHNGVFSGIIARMFMKPGEDPNEACTACTDDRHNHTWLGLEIIRGMKPEGDAKFGDGTILDPRDGKIYKATMKVSPDGQVLTVRGYIGIELLGQNQYWTRLPDSAYSMLDPAISPNPATAKRPALPPQPAQSPPPRRSEAPAPAPNPAQPQSNTAGR